MSTKLNCHINSRTQDYEIEIQQGALNHQAKYLATLGSKFAIITDDTVRPLYGEKFLKLLLNAGLDAHLLSFSAGEQQKNHETKQQLENQLLEKKFGRDSCIIALGGGVTTDLAGYVAATYCRGIPLVMAPTTLLGMVDACIGGKTGINTSYGKNLVGSIYQPKKIVIDTSTLKSLPQKELSNGVVEMIKHGIIADLKLFEYLESHSPQLLALDSNVLEKSIYESCRIKKNIVEEDETENGKRRLLNFGHTIGHALEQLSNYTMPHGEAVAIGMLIESHLAVQLKYLPIDTLKRIKKILIDYKLPLLLPMQFSMKSMLDVMTLDKKSVKGLPRFVIIDSIGSAQHFNSAYCTTVDESMIKKALEWISHDLHAN